MKIKKSVSYQHTNKSQAPNHLKKMIPSTWILISFFQKQSSCIIEQSQSIYRLVLVLLRCVFINCQSKSNSIVCNKTKKTESTKVFNQFTIVTLSLLRSTFVTLIWFITKWIIMIGPIFTVLTSPAVSNPLPIWKILVRNFLKSFLRWSSKTQPLRSNRTMNLILSLRMAI